MSRSPITTHVLDTSRGLPAAGVQVSLQHRESDSGGTTWWTEVVTSSTDDDGRVNGLLAPGALLEGVYRLVFDTETWFAGRGIETFYPSVTIEFRVKSASEHHHVPLLLNPFGYSTYRGS